ncbi:MAG: DUF4249 family protein [Candidatus Electryonea clarkiae]|nr:DUF4249 family protein [Candidatus Electryonea clarkiae]MDP8287822.1 DUF4249 family protein [Candidatus Electryonea clarkiae]
MRNLNFLLLVSVIAIIGCTEESLVVPENDQIVVRAYLYTGKPVEEIQISSTFLLDEEIETAPVINDAQISLIRDSRRFQLIPSPGDSGYYHYPGEDLIILAGEKYLIEVDYFGSIATAQTIVPPAPTDVSLSSNLLVVPDFSNFTRGSRPEFDNFTFTAYWNNDDNKFFYLVIDNLGSNPPPIDAPFAGKMANFISQPVRSDSFVVSVGMVTHLGSHRLIVYRINQEYADMYEWRNQDSRDLNEPLTNIENGLGVFSAFNSDSLFFEVEMD